MGKSLSESRLIVGLGNPGKEYEYTRHNLGFLVARQLSERLKIDFELSSLTNGLTAEGQTGSCEVCLLMPLTYMNNSGVAVKQLLNSKKFDVKDILIVCDDLNLPFRETRIRKKGSDGGNNGLGSVIDHLKTDDFARLRMGIGQPPTKKDTVDYVLEEFKRSEEKHLDDFVDQAAECCLLWLKDGINKAMEKYNRRSTSSNF